MFYSKSVLLYFTSLHTILDQMVNENQQLHVFFFPYMAHGHMIPMVDMAKLFASHGVKSTIITTPLNACILSNSIQRAKSKGLDIDIVTIKFPAVENGLPEDCESVDWITAQGHGVDYMMKFFKAIAMLQEPLEKLLQEVNPHCIVFDMLCPWTNDSALKFGICGLAFHGTGFFARCASESVVAYEPHKRVNSDFDPFLVPNIPDEIMLTRSVLPSYQKDQSENIIKQMKREAAKSELASFGVIVNSFYELEPAYADHYRNILKRKAWHIGPLSLCNRDIENKANRGKKAAINERECLNWLDSKDPNSVIYICFGSAANFTTYQLEQIAIALETSGLQFIWVVRKDKEREEESFLDEFEKRSKGKGLIIKGWAPQLLILGHEAIGGFVTHCGWNSVLEGITAGKPMVTWPVSAEQFYNEKLVTDVLSIGVGVGAKQWIRIYGDKVGSEAIEKAMKRVMIGEEGEEMRRKSKALGDAAINAVEEGGSSYCDMKSLIEELKIRNLY